MSKSFNPSSPQTLRVFTGIQIPPPLLDGAQNTILKSNLFKEPLKWINFATAHFTLHFFSDLPADRLEEFTEITNQIISQHPPLSITLAKPGFFPDESMAKVFWWGIEKNEELVCLLDDLGECCRKNAFKIDYHPYVPHATFGRFKKPTKISADVVGELVNVCRLAGKSFVADNVKLYKSPQRPNGYKSLREFSFKKI